MADVRQYAVLRENQERNHKDIIKHMNAKQSRLLAAMERKQNLRIWSEETQMSVLQDVMVLLDGKISELEEKLLEASEEMRTLRAERRVEVEEWRVTYTARTSVGRETGSTSSVGGSQKKRKAAVRKEPVET